MQKYNTKHTATKLFPLHMGILTATLQACSQRGVLLLVIGVSCFYSNIQSFSISVISFAGT